MMGSFQARSQSAMTWTDYERAIKVSVRKVSRFLREAWKGTLIRILMDLTYSASLARNFPCVTDRFKNVERQTISTIFL